MASCFQLACMVAVILGLQTATVASAAFDCDSGCATTWDPVCGADGVTYVNECVATCQDIVISMAGTCKASSLPASRALEANQKPRRMREDGLVDRSVMDRYKNQGFVFTGYEHFSKRGAGRARATSTPAKPQERKATASSDVQAHRATREGYVYTTTPHRRHLLDAQDVPAFTKSFVPEGVSRADLGAIDEGKRRRLRDLLIFGIDERVQVVDPVATGFPFTVVGQLESDVDVTDDSISLCSATLISPDSILTAGHCVYELDEDTGIVSWLNINLDATSFHPGRTSDGLTYFDPYGSYRIDEVTTFAAWTDSVDAGAPDFAWDLAVMKLAPDADGLNAGDAHGYLGMTADVCPTPYLRFAGYPADKPRYTQWASGECSADAYTCQADFFYTNCDLARGHSGSAAWYTEADGQVRAHGVVSHSTTPLALGPTDQSVSDSAWPTTYNAFTMITLEKWPIIYEAAYHQPWVARA